MSQSTETQVRAAFVGLDELQSAVTIADILHAAGPVRPLAEPLPQHRARSWSLRPVWLGLAAAAVIAVLVAAPLLWSGAQDAPPATTPSTVSTTLPETTPTTSAESDPDGTSEDVGDSAVPAPSSQIVVPPGPAPSIEGLPSLASAGWNSGQVHGISVDSEQIGPFAFRLPTGEWLAYDSGWDGTPTNAADETAYLYDSTSTSASVKWQGFPLPFGEGTWTSASHVMSRRGNPPLIVHEFDGDQFAAVWSTVDGLTWTQLDFGDADVSFVGDWYQIDDVVLAYGSHDTPGGSDLFVSTDGGKTFSLVDHPVLGGNGQFTSIYTTTAGFGALVWALPEGADRRIPQIWASTNGTEWTLKGEPTGLPLHVTEATEDRINIDGLSALLDAGVYCITEDAQPGGGCRIDAIRSDLLVATFNTFSDNFGTRNTWFHSTDGLTWEPSTRFPVELTEIEVSTDIATEVIDDWLVLTVSDPNDGVVVPTIVATQDLYTWFSDPLEGNVWNLYARPLSVQWQTRSQWEPMSFVEPSR